jgi:uncharacterized protein DUF3306
MSKEGFLGRWSKRKLEAKQEKAVEAEPARELPSPQPSPASGRGSETGSQSRLANGRGSETGSQSRLASEAAMTEAATGLAPSAPGGEGGGEGPAQAPLPPTIEDVKALTAESDFTRFAASDVAPEVKNAALKKLFADPRYNVMDGMDVYTGDYSRPDPIPHAMLRQLAGAKFLGLFREEERQEEAARPARDVADNHTHQKVAQSGSESQAVPEPPEHADPDLQLQQDHAAPGKDPGRGTG